MLYLIAGWITEGGLVRSPLVPRGWLLAETAGGQINGLVYISSTGIVALDSNPVGDAHHVAPRVTKGVGINSDQRQVGCDQAGLLSEFAGGGVLRRLPVFDVAARQRVPTAEGRMFPTDKQQPAARIEHDAVDGERWTFGVHGNAAVMVNPSDEPCASSSLVETRGTGLVAELPM